MKLPRLLFVLSLLLLGANALNRTFSLTAINPSYPRIHNQPVVRSYPTDPSVVGVGFSPPYASPLKAFIHNNKLYQYCNTSPTGVCIGYFQKNHGGATMGLRLQFWSHENFPASSPCCSVEGNWSIQVINGMRYLLSSGSDTYQMCEYAGGYSIESGSPGACVYGTKIKALYDF
ncbi:uncharacterized protein LAJ45_10791 [Morchella importuna]|uniref:Uncharacterized protein n=1 Tax=Morchella conica CCBAS932 TaxID=1392247 RepID=A0A3N4KEW2_9PEZI|nr:uncharacterized protein LAJ45_10791 [Morchella importuna]KAH8145230.1 hypothetical protein LAJ45_10791 [Morchella importuna]RPB07899.1 hypothetical protein P167DRAFT_609160 [Morchella conica CCBAS932]